MSDSTPSVSLDRLLVHRAWVRALARRLSTDDSSALDLEQDMWVTALTRPPGDAHSIRGWIARVLRNRATDRFRAESRRTRREEAVARPLATRSAADLVADAETHQQVVRAVMELEEPYRATILFRFYEGLAPREIAARTGVPVSTVRTRVRRGLERIREALVRDDDRNVRALLAPLLGMRSPARPVRWAIPVAAAGLVAVALLAWTVREPKVNTPPDATVANLSSVTKTSRPRRSSPLRRARFEPEVREGSPVAALLGDDGHLSGTVSGPQGTPVSGARVFAVRTPWGGGQRPGRVVRGPQVADLFVTTDAAGAFAIPLDPGQAVTIAVQAPGYAPFELPDCQVGERVDVRLFEGVGLDVTVVSPQGQVVEGARVSVLRPEFDASKAPRIRRTQVTDAAGRARFRGLPPGSWARLRCEHPGVGAGRKRVDLPISGVAHVRANLSPGWLLQGEVIDEVTGQPVAGASVRRAEFDSVAVRTDGAGRFEIAGWSVPGPDKRLTTTAAGYGEKTVRLQSGGPARIVIAPAASVTGSLRTPDGEAAAGATVVATWRDGRRYAMTDSEGHFLLEGLPGGPGLVLVARAAGFARLDCSPATVAGKATDVGVLILSPGVDLHGTVTDADGSPRPGIRVLITGPGKPSTTDDISESRRTDHLGRFRFTGVAPGSYRVSADVPGEVKVERVVDVSIASPPGPIRLRTGYGDLLDVLIVDADGRPIPGAGILAEDLTSVVFAETDRDGRARLRIDALEELTIYPYNSDKPVLADLKFELPPGTTEYRVVLEPTASIRGIVLDQHGNPVVLPKLTVTQNGHPVPQWKDHADAAGRFRLVVRALAPVTIRVIASPAGTGELTEVSPGATDMRLRVRHAPTEEEDR